MIGGRTSERGLRMVAMTFQLASESNAQVFESVIRGA